MTWTSAGEAMSAVVGRPSGRSALFRLYLGHSPRPGGPQPGEGHVGAPHPHSGCPGAGPGVPPAVPTVTRSKTQVPLGSRLASSLGAQPGSRESRGCQGLHDSSGHLRHASELARRREVSQMALLLEGPQMGFSHPGLSGPTLCSGAELTLRVQVVCQQQQTCWAAGAQGRGPGEVASAARAAALTLPPFCRPNPEDIGAKAALGGPHRTPTSDGKARLRAGCTGR